MTSSEPPPWASCQACGHDGHSFHQHLDDVAAPAFVHECVVHLRELERAGGPVRPLVEQVSQIAEDEDDTGRKAWAMWLAKLLEELDDASDAPEVAAEIENYLLGGHWA